MTQRDFTAERRKAQTDNFKVLYGPRKDAPRMSRVFKHPKRKPVNVALASAHSDILSCRAAMEQIIVSYRKGEFPIEHADRMMLSALRFYAKGADDTLLKEVRRRSLAKRRAPVSGKRF